VETLLTSNKPPLPTTLPASHVHSSIKYNNIQIIQKLFNPCGHSIKWLTRLSSKGWLTPWSTSVVVDMYGFWDVWHYGYLKTSTDFNVNMLTSRWMEHSSSYCTTHPRHHSAGRQACIHSSKMGAWFRVFYPIWHLALIDLRRIQQICDLLPLDKK